MKKNLFVLSLTILCSVLLSSVFAFEVVNYELAKDGYTYMPSSQLQATHSNYQLYKLGQDSSDYYIDASQWANTPVFNIAQNWKTDDIVIVVNGQQHKLVRVPAKWVEPFLSAPTVVELQHVAKSFNDVSGQSERE